MGTIGAILNLFSGGGSTVYHLLILLALEAAVGIALVEYRHTRNPDQRRFFLAFLGILLLRIPILAGDPLQNAILTPFLDAFLSLLIYALEVVSLTLMWWAFLSPLVGRLGSRIFLLTNLALALVLSAAFFPAWYHHLSTLPTALYQEADLSLYYITFWQQPVWDLWATLLPLSAAVILFRQRHRLGYSMPAVSFALITLGNGLILFDQIGLGRLINLFGYPLLAIAVYRTALQDLWAYRNELETLSEESLRQTREILSLIEISRAIGELLDMDTLLRRVVEAIVHALDADRAAILLAGPEPGEMLLAAQYTPLHTISSTKAKTISTGRHSVLDHAVRRQRQLILIPKNQQLQPLYKLLGSDESGPTIIQPLIRKEQTLGIMLVGNDHTKRPFSDNDARLCNSIATQVSAAIDNARLYRSLSLALKTQEEETDRREAILESIAEGVIVTDAAGKAVLMNAAAEDLLGVTRRQILGRPLQQMLEPATTSQPNLRQLTESPTHLQAIFDLENKQIHVSAAPVRNAVGEQMGLVAVLRDVTREVQAERAKREFIATISHELRTPLTAILGYAEALYSGMVGTLNQSQEQFIHIIHDNARRMVSMANNLIALSEAERGRLELEYAETDLSLIANEVAHTFAPQIQSRQIEWKLQIEDDLPPIEADPNRIRQVLANLVSNAVKYTLPGGHVTMGIEMMPATSETQPRFCKIWVQDTGVGIPPQEQHRVWERFYRADNPLKVEAGGIGVGLSIVRSLVHAHGGRVWLDSDPGEGSTFTVLLPASPQPSPSLAGNGYPDVEIATNI